ncbi:MAG: TonB-dependent receptor [Pseudomonadota bacterium]
MSESRSVRRYRQSLCASGVALCLMPLALLADEQLEEVTVMAQKREQNLQDVGISIAAFSQAGLKNMGVTSVSQLGSMVPGVNIFQFGQDATTTITIRGVSQNDFADHNEAPVAVYQDGAYNSFIGGAGLVLFDVDRVEILRGPQGTLFGRNATGGLVQIITKKPTDAFEAYATADGGQYGLARLEGAVSGPLSERISSRLAFSATRQDGLVENTIGPDKEQTRDLSTRLQFDFHPSEDVNLLWNIRTVRDDVTGTVGYKPRASVFTPGVQNGLVRYPSSEAEHVAFCEGFFGSTPPPGSTDCYGFTDPKPNDPWTVASDTPGVMDRTIFGTTATLSWKWSPAVQFTSISDYLKLDRNYVEDTDGTSAKLFNFYSDMNSWQFSQELRLNGAAGALNWQTGVYFLDIHHNVHTGADANTGFAPDFDFFTANHNVQTTNSYSAFGQVDWAFASTWSVTGGLRYVADEKRMTIDAQCLFGGCTTLGLVSPGFVQGIGFNETTAPGQTKRSDSDVAAKLELDWRPVEGMLTYVSVNRGIKGGGFNAAAVAAIPMDLVSYKPEVLTAYEIGVKTSLFERRAQINASLFDYDYRDYQAFTLTGLSPFVFNTDATTRGAEVELRILATPTLELMVGGSYLDAEAKNIPLQFPDGPFLDQKPPQSPKFTLDAALRKSWLIANRGTVSLSLTGNHVTRRYFNTINHPVLSDDAYTLANARLSYLAANGNWEASLWGNNLTNSKYVLTAFDLSTTNGVVTQAFGPPRQVAGSFTYWLK